MKSSVSAFAVVFFFILFLNRIPSSTASAMNAAMTSIPTTGRTTARIMVVELSDVEDATEQNRIVGKLSSILK